jgi:hypothetical protein
LERFRSRSHGNDIEAGDFDETTLDQLSTPRTESHFSVGADGSDEEDAAQRNGTTDTSADRKGSEKENQGVPTYPNSPLMYRVFGLSVLYI